MNDLSFVELLRWTWRQLTSMRTALVLLFLLALASVPGSVLPQTDVDAFKVSQWQDEHPKLAPVYEKLGLFDVFGSTWFSAIYLLLVVSLVGCILPRTRVYWRALRTPPPAAPKNLTRLPVSGSFTTDAEVSDVLERAQRVLKRRRFRVRVADDAVAGERGYLREAGNLLFHVAVLVVIAGFGIGSLWGYKGGAIVIQGDEFTNTRIMYDDFSTGLLTDDDDLEEFALRVDDFDVEWLYGGPRAGMARKFVAGVTWWDADGTEDTYDLRVNHPLAIGDASVFLIGHGYAPVITVRDADGTVVFTGPTPFLPENLQTFQSFGVVKVQNAQPNQLGLEGLLLPTYNENPMQFASLLGDDKNPFLSLTAWVGDLGLDGPNQSVYVLEKSGMTQLTKPDGKMFRVDVCAKDRAGCENHTATLPEGHGTVTFEGLRPWVRIQVAEKPGTPLALAGAVLALLGLLGSLFIRPRRIWVRARRGEDGRTLVEVGLLDRSSGGEPGPELEAVMAALNDVPMEDQ